MIKKVDYLLDCIELDGDLLGLMRFEPEGYMGSKWIHMPQSRNI